MGSLAVVLGRFVGAMLAECAPVLVGILSEAIRNALKDTVEDGAVRDDLRNRLLARLRRSDSANPSGGAGPAAGASEGKDLGG